MFHSDELQCYITKIEYDYTTNVAKAYFPATNCCDMQGMINFAERLFPNVAMIETYSGGKEDTIYANTSAGWVACEAASGSGDETL